MRCILKLVHWSANSASRVFRIAFLTGNGVVTDELISTAGGAAYTKGVCMTFGPDPRLLPDAKAGVEKSRNAGTEPEGYTLYAYASLQAPTVQEIPAIKIVNLI